MRPLQQSSLRDRTSEFLTFAEKLQKQQGTSSLASTSATGSTAKNAIQQQSEFAKAASQIGLGIHKTSVKLQKLAQLAKRTSMFDDPTAEINEMTGIIKQDIQAMNASLADLQKLSMGSRDGNKQSTDHSNTVVDNLRTRLKDATQEFKEVLTVRTDNLKAHKQRISHYTTATQGMQELLLPRHKPGDRTASSLFGPSTSQAGPSGALQGNSTQQQQQQQQLLLLEKPQENSLMNSRAEALHNVESTIVDLGAIFSQLAHMVHEQGEMAQRIDENVDDALVNVEGAQASLLKYLNNISGNRWLVMKVFFVLLVFITIFVVFLV